MSVQFCPICDVQFKDGDKIIAVMLSTFKDIPSKASYAITHPTKCVEIVHSDCYDWEDHEDLREGTIQ